MEDGFKKNKEYNEAFLKRAYDALEIVAKRHDSNYRNNGGSLPGRINRGFSFYLFDAEPDIQNGIRLLDQVYYEWTWETEWQVTYSDGKPKQKERDQNIVRVIYNGDESLEILSAQGDKESFLREDTVTPDLSRTVITPVMSRSYNKDQWVQKKVLCDALYEAFENPIIEKTSYAIIERAVKPSTEWGDENRLEDPYGDPDW